MENIHSGHRQRLKQQFLNTGLNSFLPHQILEFLLFFAIPRVDTNEIAHTLLNKYGSLSAVMNAPYTELIKEKGLGENGAILIKLMPQILSKYSLDLHKETVMDNVRDVCDYFYSCYLGVKNEQLRVCCLNDNLNVVLNEVIQDGGVNTVPVNVRKIVETVYKSNCSMIIIAHNHPNGDPIASKNDISVTRQLLRILDTVGIKLLDHVIVGRRSAISMKNCGYFTIFE